MLQMNGKSPEDWIRLISTDGYSYLVQRKVAVMSGTLRNMLNNDFAEAASNTCPINERGIIVEKLCEYLQYKHTYENALPRQDGPDFTERIPPEIALELLVAADYYDSK
ncbi:uncharacterized protein PHACADRAFT_167536 [Phanerochaete carnosa HHB-10118-sp]|uniref:Elongin-C n=1 Tax=Phanerochaete carnosa (strain HHB-10118-sp) TaxID=650164 RepID=K5WDV9_PHACS|nr:uncharacterized protein PHACADRAFT_167536 [Phanerochaete carnosa HHB-10118-sp]EKM48322.1 hypothetical protein PHACADRAFT_167536 [Phanerochaete carnosa HHB-10118-sp]